MTTLFGIKNCDTVRKATKWLLSENIEFSFHDFRKDGLEPTIVETWLERINTDALINKRSTTWKALSEKDKSKIDDLDELKQLILENPTLIKRPLLEHSGNYYLGFKEAEYKSIFKD